MSIKKSKCLICLQVRGRRSCKNRDKLLICARCCAEVRNPDCGGCRYYAQAEKYAGEKIKNSRYRDIKAATDSDVGVAVDNALTLVEQGKVHAGEALLTALLEECPQHYLVHYGLGCVLGKKGNNAAALSRFDKCLELYPYFPEAWFNKAVSHSNLLDFADSLRSYQKAVEYGDVTDAYMQDARAFLRKAENQIRRDSGLSITQYLKSQEVFDGAFAKMESREYESAISDFQKVLSWDKNHIQSYGNIGLCYALLGEKTEAVKSFDRALELDPEYAPAQENKAILLGLRDGETMPGGKIGVVEFYKDKIESRKGRSSVN